MRKVKFEKGKIYHIYNRGVDKRNIFDNDNDKWRFLQGLFLFNDKESTANILWQLERSRGSVTFGVLKQFFKNNNKERAPLVRILADCLMPNHFHLLVEEIKKGGISQFMHKLGTGYTGYFNKKYERSGSLFQGTFKAMPVNIDEYLQHLLVYINVINPGQLIEPKLKEKGIKNIQKIIDFAENYQWCTNPEYLDKRKSIITEKGLLGEFFPNSSVYKELVRSVLLNKKYETLGKITLE